MNDFANYYQKLRNTRCSKRNVVTFAIDDELRFRDGSTFSQLVSEDRLRRYEELAHHRPQKRLYFKTIGWGLLLILLTSVFEFFSEVAIQIGPLLLDGAPWRFFILFEVGLFGCSVSLSSVITSRYCSKKEKYLLWADRLDLVLGIDMSSALNRRFRFYANQVCFVINSGVRESYSKQKSGLLKLSRAAEKYLHGKDAAWSFEEAADEFRFIANSFLSVKPSSVLSVFFSVSLTVLSFAFSEGAVFWQKHTINVIASFVCFLLLTVGFVFVDLFRREETELKAEYLFWVCSYAFLENGTSSKKMSLIRIKERVGRITEEREAYIENIQKYIRVCSNDVAFFDNYIDVSVDGSECLAYLERLKKQGKNAYLLQR